MEKNNEHLIVRGLQWVKELPHHEGSIGEQGFPVIMSHDLVQEASVWVCPALMKTDEKVSQAVSMGLMGKAVPHVHDGDEMYLILGEEDACTIEVLLGDDRYELTPPASVFIPAGLPHAINPIQATIGKFGGAVPVFFGKEYITKAVPENPLKIGNTKALIVEGIQWVKELPHHEGSIGEKGYPVLMSHDLVEAANVWVCPALMKADAKVSMAIEKGLMGKATPHTHDEDEMYLLLGEDDTATFRVLLGEENFEVDVPAAVYIPAGMPHAIEAIRAQEGKWGGACPVFLGSEYITKPIEA